MLENDPWLSDAIHFPTSNCEPRLSGAARLRCTDPGAFSWIGRLLSQRIKRRRSPGYEASLAFVKKMTIRYFISERKFHRFFSFVKASTFAGTPRSDRPATGQIAVAGCAAWHQSPGREDGDLGADGAHAAAQPARPQPAQDRRAA